MTNIDEELLKREMQKYEEEIKKVQGSDKNRIDYVPTFLYHGSPESLDVINSKESTQKGTYVYATDNPIQALFFSIFRNSSVARASINEHIDENGNYRVKYIIDERIKGALDEIITDREITIHICDGSQFFKPKGASYTEREWISKEGQSIIPIDRIHINVKKFFEELEREGLVEYSRYDKSKDWQTVINLLGRNYPFGLGTERGKNIEEFDAMYDEFIELNFPDQFDFSKAFRTYIKEIMSKDFKIDNPNISLEEEYDYKLRYIKQFADSFLITSKDETGKISWSVDIDKINSFMNHTTVDEDENRRKC